MKEPVIKAVVFDMDGVLYDTEKVSYSCWKEEADRLGLPNMEYVHRGACGLNHTDGAAWLRKNYGQDFDVEGFMERCNRRLKEKLDTEGIPVKEGTRQIVYWLKENMIPFAICSSTIVPTIEDHLRKTDLDGYFDAIIGGNMVEHSKPKPDIYLKACQALGQDPSECIAVEDSPNGIRSAHAAGMLPVMVPDLIAPTQELVSLCFRVEPSLLTLLEYLKSRFDR